MENITLQAQILTLRSAVDAALTTAREDKQPPQPQARWAPGDQMTARVEAALPGGRFHVRVDDMMLEMHLPDGFKPGDRIELQFVSAQPRPSFLLNSQPEPPRQDVELSRAARVLGEILKSVAPERSSSSQKDAPPAPIKAALPLLPAPSTDVPKLAQALSIALTTSGVFYESHQSQWVLGQRQVSDLLSEPQGKLSPAIKGELPARAETATPAGIDKTAAKDVFTPVTSAPNAEAKAADRSQPMPMPVPVHQDALPQVRSQLQALETQQLVWQGQLWPGQDLEWTIRDPGEEGSSGPGEPQPWFTQLRLRLPRLGALTADLALIDRTLRVRLNASSADAQNRMNAAHAALADALSAAGIDLISFKVAGDGGD